MTSEPQVRRLSVRCTKVAGWGLAAATAVLPGARVWAQQAKAAAAPTLRAEAAALPQAPSALMFGGGQAGTPQGSAPQALSGAAVSSSQPAATGAAPQQAPAVTGTSIIVGDVVDSHNGLVPDAHVTATELMPAAGTKPSPEPREAKSDSAGHFELRNLPAGAWTVTVTAAGLTTFVSPRTVLHTGERVELQGVVLSIPEQHADVTVTMTLEQVAEQEIHDEEHQRVLAVFPNYNTSYVWNAAPLNARQKFQLSAKSTFDPMSFLTAGIVASLEQAHGDFPGFGPGAPGFGKRYAAAWGTTLIGHTIGFAILPSVLRQDPRYFYMGTGSKKARAIHAIASSFLCRGNSGHTQFNTSHIAGNFIAGYIARAYYPDQNNSLTLAVDNTLIGIAGTSGVNLFREFMLKRLSTGTPKFGTGKPEAEVTKASHP